MSHKYKRIFVIVADSVGIGYEPDADKFLEIYRDEKTSFYDFTPDLIRHAKEIEEEYGKGGIDDCIGDDKTKISDVKYATNAIREELQPSKEKQEKRAENRGE